MITGQELLSIPHRNWVINFLKHELGITLAPSAKLTCKLLHSFRSEKESSFKVYVNGEMVGVAFPPAVGTPLTPVFIPQPSGEQRS